MAVCDSFEKLQWLCQTVDSRVSNLMKKPSVWSRHGFYGECTHTLTYTQILKCTHEETFTQAHMLTYERSTHQHLYTRSRRLKRAIYIFTDTHTYTQYGHTQRVLSCTHTHTQALHKVHTHTHIHMYSRSSNDVFLFNVVSL